MAIHYRTDLTDVQWTCFVGELRCPVFGLNVHFARFRQFTYSFYTFDEPSYGSISPVGCVIGNGNCFPSFDKCSHVCLKKMHKSRTIFCSISTEKDRQVHTILQCGGGEFVLYYEKTDRTNSVYDACFAV